MTAERLARHDLRFAIGGSGVEIIDAVGDGVVNHGIDGFLVQGLMPAETALTA